MSSGGSRGTRREIAKGKILRKISGFYMRKVVWAATQKLFIEEELILGKIVVMV